MLIDKRFSELCTIVTCICSIVSQNSISAFDSEDYNNLLAQHAQKLSPYSATIYASLHLKKILGGGVIVHRKYILTAAHVFTPYLSTAMSWNSMLNPKAIVGRVDTKLSQIPILEVRMHPKYEVEPPPMYDIALAELESCLDFGPNIKKANIWNLEEVHDFFQFGMFSFGEVIPEVIGGGQKNSYFHEKGFNPASTRVQLLSKYGCLAAGNTLQRFPVHEMIDSLLCGIPVDSIKVKRGSGLIPISNHNEAFVFGIYVFGPFDEKDHKPAFFFRSHKFADWANKIIFADKSCGITFSESGLKLHE